MIFGSLNYFQIKILLIKIYIIIIIFWAWPCVYIKIKFYSFNKFYPQKFKFYAVLCQFK